MDNYHFAELDGTDLDDVRRLESILVTKYGKNILVIAYEQDGMQVRQDSLSAGVDDLAGQFSMEQTQMESGYDQ